MIPDFVLTSAKSFGFAYGSHAAYRLGYLKIVREEPHQPWSLFNLSTDKAESHDLASELPEELERLEAAFEDWLAQTGLRP